MASQSLYRRWRSQTFADVVGQGHVTRTLRNALQMGRIAHAYLLCGPRGVGKTSVARILAKAVNCLQPREGEPCNECHMCSAITAGRALDVIEVDAASNRRIEEMRDLREKVNFAPTEARYKVYILDEAHMLTNEASNALLKTLEEPPPHTVFVLVTTEGHRIAETIVSRCQHFNFRRISSREIVGQLGLICTREGFAVAPEALTLIARVASGSLRDAEGLLDQLVAYCGPEISAAQARDVLGLSGDEAVLQLAECLLDGNLAAGLKLINDVADAGADLGRFGEECVRYLRGILLLKSGADVGAIGDVSADTLAAMRGCAERVSLERLVALIRIFGVLDQGTRGGTVPQLGLELALAEAILHCERERQAAAPRVVPERPARSRLPAEHAPQRADRAETPLNRPPVAVPAAIAPAAAMERPPDGPGVSTAPSGNGGSGDEQPSAITGRPEPPAPDAPGALLENLQRRWKTEVVESLFAANKLLQALLRSCDPCDLRDGHVIIGCDAPFHRDKLGEIQNRSALEKALTELLGTPVLLQFQVVPRPKRGQPAPATSDPRVKEVLSWGGRIRAVTSEAGFTTATDRPTVEPAKADEEVQ